MMPEKFFWWSGKMLQASQIKDLGRAGKRVVCRYRRQPICLNHCADATEARLALSLLKAKVNGVDAREGQ